MKWLLMLSGILSLYAEADNSSQVSGLWASDRSILEVSESNGNLQGIIIAMQDPVYTPDEDKKRAGKPRIDDNNPDKALRKRTILGLDIFAAYRLNDGEWQGKIYDPESGKTYKSQMHVGTDGRLEIRGYVGIPMFGRTASFDPVNACLEHIVEMLKMTARADLCF